MTLLKQCDFKEIPVSSIKVSKFNPRRFYDEEALDDLMHSLEEKGHISPVILSPLPNDQFELVIGSRRLEAVRKMGYSTIPAVIKDNLTEQDVLELSLSENLQRQDLTPFEEGWVVLKLMKDHNLGTHEIARRISKSPAFVRQRVKLMSMPKEVQGLLRERQISLSHISRLTDLESPEEQIQFAKAVAGHRLTKEELSVCIEEEAGKKRRPYKEHDWTEKKMTFRIKRFSCSLKSLQPQLVSVKDNKDEVVGALKELERVVQSILKEM